MKPMGKKKAATKSIRRSIDERMIWLYGFEASKSSWVSCNFLIECKIVFQQFIRKLVSRSHTKCTRTFCCHHIFRYQQIWTCVFFSLRSLPLVLSFRSSVSLSYALEVKMTSTIEKPNVMMFMVVWKHKQMHRIQRHTPKTCISTRLAINIGRVVINRNDNNNNVNSSSSSGSNTKIKYYDWIYLD